MPFKDMEISQVFNMKLRDKTFEEWLAVHHERANPNLQTVHKVAFNAGWDALQGYREDCILEGDEMYDEQWNDICTAMAWAQETLQNESKQP